MIKLENVVLASPKQMEFIIQGMRNPLNSWDRGDSITCYKCYQLERDTDPDGEDLCAHCGVVEGFNLGENDRDLMRRLSNAGTEHRKYMRMIPVYVRITAPLYW